MRHRIPKSVFRPVPRGVVPILSLLLSLLLALVLLGIFRSEAAGLVAALLVFGSGVAGWFIYLSRLDRRVNRRTSKKPHEVIDNFFQWEQGDRVRLGRGPSYKAWTGIYKGVTGNGGVLISPCRLNDVPVEYICGRKCRFDKSSFSDDLLRVSPAAFEALPYENTSLNERREEQLLEQEAGNYDEMVQEVKREIQDRPDDRTGTDPDVPRPGALISPIEFPTLQPGS